MIRPRCTRAGPRDCPTRRSGVSCRHYTHPHFDRYSDPCDLGRAPVQSRAAARRPALYRSCAMRLRAMLAACFLAPFAAAPAPAQTIDDLCIRGLQTIPPGAAIAAVTIVYGGTTVISAPSHPGLRSRRASRHRGLSLHGGGPHGRGGARSRPRPRLAGVERHGHRHRAFRAVSQPAERQRYRRATGRRPAARGHAFRARRYRGEKRCGETCCNATTPTGPQALSASPVTASMRSAAKLAASWKGCNSSVAPRACSSCATRSVSAESTTSPP
jgi:hypothetical protein